MPWHRVLSVQLSILPFRIARFSEMPLDNREELDVDLKKYLLALKRQALLGLALFGLSMTGFTVLAFSLESTYRAEGKLLFRPTDKTTPWLGSAPGTGELRSLMSSQTPLSTEIEVLTSPPLLQGVIDRLQQAEPGAIALDVQDLRENVRIEIAGATDIISIAYQSSDPLLATRIVNAIMDSYVQEQLKKSRAETGEVRDFIASKLPQLESDLLQAEAELRAFKEKHQIVDLSEETLATAKTLENLNQQTAAIAANLNGLKAQSQGLKHKLGLDLDEAVSINVASQSPAVRAALEELAIVEKDLAEQKKYYKDEHWSVAALQDKKSLLENIIRERVGRLTSQGNQISKGLLQLSNNQGNLINTYIEIETERLNLDAQLEALAQTRQQHLNRATTLPRLEEKQRQLQRQLDVAQSSYSSLLQKLQEVQIAEDKPSSNAEIMSPALVPESGDSGKVMVLAFGIIASLFVATLGILVAELRDPSLKNLHDIRTVLNYPILGTIPICTKDTVFLGSPHDRAKGASLKALQSHSYLRDLYWVIQANLKSANYPPFPQVIVVTSSVEAEGKSVVAANLALAMSRLQDHVLLIDADLRHPCQNEIWNADNNNGLSQILREPDQDLNHRCYLNENLALLTAGQAMADPLPLLDSSQMKNLLEQARKEFDYIIIDAPPLVPMADALILGQASDGFILVARPKVIDQRSAEIAKETLDKQQKVVLGLIVNGLNSKELIKPSYYSSKGRKIEEIFNRDASMSLLEGSDPSSLTSRNQR